MTPFVSIVIPCYNHGAYIEEAIESVEKNAVIYSYEIVIIDDGSDDIITLKVLENLVIRGYNVIYQTNKGLAAARNVGINESLGKYIIPLDSDNKVNNNYLNKAIEFMEVNSSVDVVYGNPIFFGENDEIRKVGLKSVGQFDFVELINCNYIDACAVFRKSIWEKVGGYDGNMPEMGHEDWEMWVNIFLSKGRFYFLDEVCFYYRVAAGSMISKDATRKHQVNKNYIYKKHYDRIIPYFVELVQQQRNDEKLGTGDSKLPSGLRYILNKVFHH